MPDSQQACAFQCPYCASENTETVDLTGGKEQKFTTDCMVCCRPIAITLTIAGGEIVDFEAERESP